MLLFGLLLWQNPVLAVEEWMVGGFSGSWLWARFARDLCQCVGMQVRQGEGGGLELFWGASGGVSCVSERPPLFSGVFVFVRLRRVNNAPRSNSLQEGARSSFRGNQTGMKSMGEVRQTPSSSSPPLLRPFLQGSTQTRERSVSCRVGCVAYARHHYV